MSLRRATWLTTEHVVHLADTPPLYIRPDGSVGAISFRCKMIFYAKSWLEWTYKPRQVHLHELPAEDAMTIAEKLDRIRDHVHLDFAEPARDRTVAHADYWAWRTGIAEGCVLYLLSLIPEENLPPARTRP